MIRVVSAAVRNPDRSLAEFRRHWTEHHGPLVAGLSAVRRYVQQPTLEEAYGDDPAPTYDGASKFWFDDVDSMVAEPTDPEQVRRRTAVAADDARLFDRSTSWPTDHRKATVLGTERVLLDGAPAPGMITVLFFSARRPGLTLEEFFGRWAGGHGALNTQLPGIRRYVQTHALPSSYSLPGVHAPTHDGCAELWFDDYRSWKSALASRAWSAVVESGESLFARPAAYTVGRERVQIDRT
jgi:uncharacterized protein (TIGR02118 family)